MTTDPSTAPEGVPAVTTLQGIPVDAGGTAPDPMAPVSRGSPEGRYLNAAGKPFHRLWTELQARLVAAIAKVNERAGSARRTQQAEQEGRDNHRGGDRPWPLRLAIPVCVVAEAGMAYVAMESLVSSQSLAVGLSVLTAAVGTGLACILANRRLNRLTVPGGARILEAAFVGILTALRYESMHILGASVPVALGAAALAAMISALALLGIEEIIVETQTFGMFLRSRQLSWKRWRYHAATTRLARIQARIAVAAGDLERHYLNFLLKIEGFPLDEAQERAAAFRAAIAGRVA
jgi:hypothetical protein